METPLYKKIHSVQVSLYCIALYFVVLLVNATGFLAASRFMVANSFVISLFAIVVTAMAVAYKRKQQKHAPAYVIINLALFTGILLLLILLSIVFWDTSFDGQTYHLRGVDAIANGWNPSRTEFNEVVVNNFPKAFEKFGAAIYGFTREIETAKVSNLLLVIAAWLLASSWFKYVMPGKAWAPFIYASLLIINPVIAVQSFTFLVDGQIATVFLVLTFSFLLYLKGVKLALPIWLFAVSICIDVKFTGLVYAALFQFFAAVWLLFFRFHVKRVATFILLNIAVALLSVFVISNNPYYTHLTSGKHIFYPLQGKEAVNIMTGSNAPVSFAGENRFQKFFRAQFAASGNTHGARVAPEPVLKIPFSLKIKEFTVFKSGSVLYGGFGPLFSGILVLSVILLVYVFTLNVQYKREMALLTVFLLFTVFINPECWLSRYVPQLWYFPVLVLLFVRLSGIQSKIVNYLGNAVFALAVVNGVIILAVSLLSTLMLTVQIRNEYAWLQNSHAKVGLITNTFESPAYRLKKYHVAYEIVDSASRQKFTPYYEFHLITTQAIIWVPENVKPYQPGKLFTMLESYIKNK